MRIASLALLALLPMALNAQQKKPLDHTVYDSWQNIGERILSPDGHWIAYTVAVQEGDDTLIVVGRDTALSVPIARGYEAAFSADSRFLVCKIKPLYKDIRQARIKKKKPEESPKDSLGILTLGQSLVVRVAGVKSYRLGERGGDWLAYQLETPIEVKGKGKGKDTARVAKGLMPDPADAESDESTADKKAEGSELILRDLSIGQEHRWRGVGEYQLGKKGNLLAFGVIGTNKDSLFPGYFCLWAGEKTDTILRGGKGFPKIAIDDEGAQAAFLGVRDSAIAGVQSRTYQLWYYKKGNDSARLLVTKTTLGMKVGWSVSENGTLSFSPSGMRLLVGTAPIQPPKDTNIAETEVARLDIWNYKEDYLQPMQLRDRDRELKRTYLAVYDLGRDVFTQLGDITLPTVLPTGEGDGDMFLGLSDYGKRVSMQWEGKTRKDVYAIYPVSGMATLVQRDLDGNATASPDGRYLLWYDAKARQYFTYGASRVIRNISGKVRKPLYDEENDVPDDPDEYGVAGWIKGDSSVWVYDRYDIWALDPNAQAKPALVTGGLGRRERLVFRYQALDRDEHFIDPSRNIWLQTFNDSTKESGYSLLSANAQSLTSNLYGRFMVRRLVKAKNADVFLFTRESYDQPANLWVGAEPATAVRITAIDPQQNDYNWVKAQLVHWTTFKGKKADGILYLPEDFDPTRKYPMITYFYERLSDGLYDYHGPAPTPSALNIPFFVSRGYLVFTPDIRYTIGHPGKSAYDYIVSGVQYLCRRSYVDKGRLGVQGQSWGGYQVAYLITATHIFKAAWAGAPVVNMFSAYGGIRWESGMNRQFQYEHTQSRIGATPWDKPELYIENSPLFHLPNVTTPLVIMANDNDGAVPWYQGIEMFTDMRRLGKPVWMLTYNGEAHNLMERRNRKDIQIREQQFFDWQLKDGRPARWLTEGVPATAKGRDWGLELDDAP